MPIGGGVVSSNSADSRRASLLSSRGGSGSLAGGPMGLSGGGFDSPTMSHLSGASALDFSGVQDLPPPHESAYGYMSESETASDVGAPVLSALSRLSLVVTPAPAVGHGHAHGHGYGYGQSTSTSTSTSSGHGGELIQRRTSTDSRVGPGSHEIQGNEGGGLSAVTGHMRPGPAYGHTATESQQTRPPMQKQSELLCHSTSSDKSDRNRLKPTNTCDTDMSSVVFETDPVPGPNPGHADQWKCVNQGAEPSRNPPLPMQPQLLQQQQYQWPTSLNQCLMPSELLEKYQLPRRYVNSLFDRWTKNFGSDPSFDNRGGNSYGAGGFYGRFQIPNQIIQSNPYLNPNPFCMLQPFTSSMSYAPSPLPQALGQFPYPPMGITGAQSHYFPMEARGMSGSELSGGSDGASGGRNYSDAVDDELNALPYIIGRRNSNTTECADDDCSVRVFEEAAAGFEEVAASSALDTCASSEASGVSPSIWPPTSADQIAQQFEQRQHEISEKLRKFRRSCGLARMITAMDLESRKRLLQKRRIGLERSSTMAASPDDDEPTAIVTDFPGHSTGELLEHLNREMLLNSDSSASDHSDPHSLEQQSTDIRGSEEEQEASSTQVNRPLKSLRKQKSLAADQTTSSGMPLHRMVSIIRASRKWKRLIKQHSLPPFLETVDEENSSETSAGDEPLLEATRPQPLPPGARKLEAPVDSNSHEEQIAPLGSQAKVQQQRQQFFRASRRCLRSSSSPVQHNTNSDTNSYPSFLQSCLKFDDPRTKGSSPEPLSAARQQTLKQRSSSSSEYTSTSTPLFRVARNLQLLRSVYKSCEQKAPLGPLHRMHTISGVEPLAAVLPLPAKQQQPLSACSFQSQSDFQSEGSAGALQLSFQSAQQMGAVFTRAIAGSTESAQQSRQPPQPPSRSFQKRPMHLSLPRCFSVDEERGKRSPTQQRQQPAHSTTFSFESVGAQSSSAIAVAVTCDAATHTDDDMEDDSPLEQWHTSEECDGDGDVEGYTELTKAAEKKREAKLEVRQFTVHTEQPRFDKCCPSSPSALDKCLKRMPTPAPSGSKCATRSPSVADECLSRSPSVNSSAEVGAIVGAVGKCCLALSPNAIDSTSTSTCRPLANGVRGTCAGVRISVPMGSSGGASDSSAPQAYNNLALAGLGSTRDTNGSLESGESEYSFAIAGGGGGCAHKWLSRASSCASSCACAAGQLRALASPAATAVEPVIPIDMANSSNGEQQNHSDRMRHQSESSSKGPSLSCEADSAAAGEQQDGEEDESTTHTPHPAESKHLEAAFEVENAVRRASFMVSRASMPTLGRRRMWRQHAVQHDDEHQQQLHGHRHPMGYPFPMSIRVRPLRPDESLTPPMYQSTTSMQPRRYSLASIHPTSVAQGQDGDDCCSDGGGGGGGRGGGGGGGGRMGRGRGEALRRSSSISELEKHFTERRSSGRRHVSFSAQLKECGDTTTTASGTESDAESSVNSLLSPRIQLRGTQAGLSACVPADKCDAHTSEEASGGVEEGNQNNAYCNTELLRLAAESEGEYGSVKSEERTLPINAERQVDSRNEEDNADRASNTCISPPVSLEEPSIPPTPPLEPALQNPSSRRVRFPSISTASITISSSNSQRTSSKCASIQAAASVESVAVQTESDTCPQTTFTPPLRPSTRDPSTRCASVQTTDGACIEQRERVRLLAAATGTEAAWSAQSERANSLLALTLLVAPCEPEFLALPQPREKPNAKESSRARGPSGGPIGSNRASEATPGFLSAPMVDEQIKLKSRAEPIDRTTAHWAPPLPATANMFITANSGVRESEPAGIGNLRGGRLEIQQSLISQRSHSHMGLVYDYHSRGRGGPVILQKKTQGSILPHSPYSLPLCSHNRHTQDDNSNSTGTLHSTPRALTLRQSESYNEQQVEGNLLAQVQAQLLLRRRLPTFWQVLQEEGLVVVATRPEFYPLPDFIPFQRGIALV